MPTPAERKALLFLAGVIVLGAGVRVVRVVRAARGGGASDATSSQALARQIAAVDSARGSDARSRRPKSNGRSADRRTSGRRARPRSTADSGAHSDSAERWVREPLSVV